MKGYGTRYAIDASLRPSWVATAAEYAPDLTARFSVVARLNFATIGILPANDAGVTMDPISNVILALGGYEADGPSMVLGSTARRVDTYRDVTDSAHAHRYYSVTLAPTYPPSRKKNSYYMTL